MVGELDIRPVMPSDWDDLAELFGPRGAYADCWCAWYLLTGAGWQASTPAERKQLLRQLVDTESEPGLLARHHGEVIGWCAVGPRERYARMMSPRARVYRRFDDQPTWVVNCFYIQAGHRREGVAAALLDAAVEFATDRGATIIEGYPIDTAVRPKATSDALYVGTLAMFERAGFVEVDRTGDRPLVRLTTG